MSKMGEWAMELQEQAPGWLVDDDSDYEYWCWCIEQVRASSSTDCAYV